MVPRILQLERNPVLLSKGRAVFFVVFSLPAYLKEILLIDCDGMKIMTAVELVLRKSGSLERL